MNFTEPKPPIPESLRGLPPGTWAHDTIVRRFGEIVGRVLAEGVFEGEVVGRLEGLVGEIPYGAVRLLEDEAPDAEAWAGYIEPYVGQNWLEVPWFFVETYFYRRILEAVGYFGRGRGTSPPKHVPTKEGSGGIEGGRDPFAYEKRRGLEVARGAIRGLSERLGEALGDEIGRREGFVELLKVDLWGNQADLSLWPASSSASRPIAPAPSRILVDDSQAVADYLFGLEAEGARVDFIVDNAGFELVCDLCLADFMLSTNLVQRVIFHLKHHPTFVSDAMIKDVRETLAFFVADGHSELRALGERLQAHLDGGRFEWRDDPYWTSSLAFWELPEALREELAHSSLLISKGDANYRRLLGDRDWPFTTPFADIMRYTPAPLLALRTLKAELAAGLQAEQIERVSRQDPNWLVNGEWGVVQFVEGGGMVNGQWSMVNGQLTCDACVAIKN